ncbi:hypothetical protein D9619_010267 [Psilocybe cf. subviscida]|uniref:Uncharacterized protein n=1 Tax=Psilocybe cf. subviscida TaxID=2480587 RepID=A0A8H5AS04_9AGAR|nr:hypothetical protein D9619_010267 [Psilocybe cf. subviscida]
MPGLGWWTHRLDVNLRDYLDAPEDTEEVVARVLTHMPNLRILTFSDTQTLIRGVYVTRSPAVLQALDCCQDTLESIHFYLPPDPSCGDWTEFLENHPEIQSINGNLPILRNSQIILDKLTTMHVSSYSFEADSYYPWHLDLPSLRAITYGLGAYGTPSVTNKDFFERVGPQLTILQVSFVQAAWYAPTTLANSLRLVFTNVLETCHNLEQVNFVFHSWGSLSLYAPIFPPKVHKLGIRIVTPQVSKSMTLAMFTSSLRVIARQNPSLKAIQFLSRRNVQALHHCHCQLHEGLRVLKATGVDVLDDGGAVM